MASLYRDCSLLSATIAVLLGLACCVPRPRAHNAPPQVQTVNGVTGYLNVLIGTAGHRMTIMGVIYQGRTATNGFLIVQVSKGDQVRYLPHQDVSGRFEAEYSTGEFIGWDYAVTLQAHVADSHGLSTVVTTRNGVIR